MPPVLTWDLTEGYPRVHLSGRMPLTFLAFKQDIASNNLSLTSKFLNFLQCQYLAIGVFKNYMTFFKKSLEDTSPFLSGTDTSVLDFW